MTSRSRSVSSSRGSGRRRLLRARGELLDHAAGHTGREERLAARDEAHRGQQVDRLGVLHEESAGAGAERLEDVLVEREGREDHDPDGGEAGVGGDLAGGGETVELGHADVHQDDVGLLLARERERLAAVARLADHPDVVLGVEEGAEAAADERLVVRKQDLDPRSPSGGSRSCGCSGWGWRRRSSSTRQW